MSKVGNCKPPIEHRFSSTNQPKKKGRHKGSSATDYLRKLSHTNIRFKNPLTDKIETGEVNLVVAIQLILKATQDSDLPSIKEYFDRLDGKIPQKLIGEGLSQINYHVINFNGKPKDNIDTNSRVSGIDTSMADRNSANI